MSRVRESDVAWLQAEAHALDRGTSDEEALLDKLGATGIFGIGVPPALGGEGGDVTDAIDAIAAVAEYSLTAAFVFWGQRSFIEYLLQSPNATLRARWLPSLLKGDFAGATGLSNAMKFIGGIESLQIDASSHDRGWQLDGKLHWVTNLRKRGFVVAAAVARTDGAPPVITALPHDRGGLLRSADLDLFALRGSNTAAVDLSDVRIDVDDLIHDDAYYFLPRVRPAFLGMQCGLSIGLARASLHAASASSASHGEHARAFIQTRAREQGAFLDAAVAQLKVGLRENSFVADAISLFKLRIRLAEIVQSAIALELETSGGRAYLQDHNENFARRWREAAFIPIVTPSLSQLHGELHRHATRPVEAVA